MKSIKFRDDVLKMKLDTLEARGVAQSRLLIKPQPIADVAELKEHSSIREYWIPYAADRRMVNNNTGNHPNDCGYRCKYIAGERYKIDGVGVVNVTSVRCERLQSITFDDCLAEGIIWSEQWETVDYKPPELLHPGIWREYARQAYAKLWDSLYPDNLWNSNPWVWVIEFKKEVRKERNERN